MKNKVLLVLLMFCLLAIPALAEDDANYINTSIEITREYQDTDDNTTITNFNITFGDYFKDLDKIVLYCDYDNTESTYYEKDDDDPISIDNDDDWDTIRDADDWIAQEVDLDFFNNIQIERVGSSLSLDLQNFTDSIYNLSATTVESLQFSAKLADSEKNLGVCTGSYDGCKIRSEEFENSTNYYKELFENTSSVCRGTESDLTGCKKDLSDANAEYGQCTKDLEKSNSSKTAIGFIWCLIGGVAGYLLGKRKEAVPPEFEQFPENAP